MDRCYSGAVSGRLLERAEVVQLCYSARSVHGRSQIMAAIQITGTPVDTPVLSIAAPGELKFGSGDGFYVELRRRVEQYFRTTGQGPRDRPKMYLKTAVVVGWLAASYGLLVFFAATWWLAVPLAVSLGLAMAAVGFNVMHDGGHRAY